MQFLVYDKSIAGSDEDDCRVAGNIEAIFEAAYEPVTDGKAIVALRVDIDGAHIITDEVIEAVAARYLKTFEQGDRVPAWLEATDAYDEFVGECEAGNNDWRAYERDVRKSYVAGIL